MYSYEDFKKKLDRTYGFSEKEIFYIIGVFFDKTDGFTHRYKETFYDLRKHEIITIEWSHETFGWDYEIYDSEERCYK